MNTFEVNKINNLTFKELRNELAKSKGDPLREHLIRNLMFIRYNQHIQNKQKIQKVQVIKPKSDIKVPIDNNIVNLVDDLMNDNEEVISELHDTRDIIEYERDKANNNLMERLNSDISIRTSKIKNKTEFLLPYENDPGHNYASFKDIGAKKKDFSNIKFGK